MIKSESYYIEQLKIFYSYLYYLKYIYNLLSYNDTTFNNLKEFLNLIDEYQKQLDKEYLDEIGIRVNYYIDQSVLTHQKDFFIYFSQNYFFSTEEDKKEEIEQILQTKNEYIEINTFITNHSSIYNKNEIINYKEKINFNLPLIDKFLKFEQYFLWFNDYLSLHQTTINIFLKSDSILPIQWKFYLAIMAVSTMKNELLFRIIEEDFLIYGGDINWLIYGLDVVPNKIKKLSYFNDLLCHQPWKINKNEIQILKKNMNLNEINEAIFILILFQKIAIIEELIDIKYNNTSSNSSHNNLKNENKKSRKSLIQVLDKVDDRIQEEMINQLEQIKKEEDENEEKEFEFEDFDKNFNFFSNELEKHQDSFNSSDSTKGNKENSLIEDFFKKHVSSENEKIAFTGSNKDIVLTYFEYDWETCLFILKNLSSTFIECLNNEIEYITSITSNSLGNKQIDNLNNKKYIHQALIHYIERLFGYYYEDYNYKNITKILSGQIKLIKYIKKFACFPKRINISDFQEMNKVFLHEEIIHIIILIGLIKAKMQLIYYSKALNETMDNKETI